MFLISNCEWRKERLILYYNLLGIIKQCLDITLSGVIELVIRERREETTIHDTLGSSLEIVKQMNQSVNPDEDIRSNVNLFVLLSIVLD